MTARVYLEVVLIGLALIALPRAARYSAATARRVLHRRQRTWLAPPGLGGAFVLVGIVFTVLHRNRGIGALALTEDPKSMGLLCALVFGGGIVLRTSWWTVMAVLAWTVTVAVSQLWMVVRLGRVAYAFHLQETFPSPLDRFDGNDVAWLTLIASAPIASSATAGVLVGHVFRSGRTWRGRVSAVSTLLGMIALAIFTWRSVDSNGQIPGETDREAWLWALALVLVGVVAAVLGSWRFAAAIPLFWLAATLAKPAMAIQSQGIANFRGNLPCDFLGLFDPCTLGGVVLFPLVAMSIFALPIALGCTLCGEVIRLGRRRKRLRRQGAPGESGSPVQPESVGRHP